MTAAGGATAVRETGRTAVANVDAVARDEMRNVTLRFNFSMVNDKLETLEREFETY